MFRYSRGLEKVRQRQREYRMKKRKAEGEEGSSTSDMIVEEDDGEELDILVQRILDDGNCINVDTYPVGIGSSRVDILFRERSSHD